MMRAWISAMRLRTLPLALSSILCGAGYAAYMDRFDPGIFAICCLTTVLLQILSNLANDLGDYLKGTDNEDRIGPERAVQSGAISAAQMKWAVVIFALLSLISGVLLLSLSFGEALDFRFLSFLFLGLLAIASAIKYTLGKGAYGYSGLGDLFVFIFFGIVGVAGSATLYLQLFDPMSLLPAVSIGCFSAAVLNLNNMRDIENDRANGKRTLVVQIGSAKALRYHFALNGIGMAAAMLFGLLNFDDPAQFAFLISFPLFVKMLRQQTQVRNPADFDPFLKRTSLATFFFSILFFFGHVGISF